jgi:hypothetical protein
MLTTQQRAIDCEIQKSIIKEMLDKEHAPQATRFQGSPLGNTGSGPRAQPVLREIIMHPCAQFVLFCLFCFVLCAQGAWMHDNL